MGEEPRPESLRLDLAVIPDSGAAEDLADGKRLSRRLYQELTALDSVEVLRSGADPALESRRPDRDIGLQIAVSPGSGLAAVVSTVTNRIVQEKSNTTVSLTIDGDTIRLPALAAQYEDAAAAFVQRHDPTGTDHPWGIGGEISADDADEGWGVAEAGWDDGDRG